MNYSIIWSHKAVRVDYSGAISVRDIQQAHNALNGDARFYDCQSLILDISNCTMDEVSVDDLLPVIGTDLGASKSITSLKVAMIAVAQQNREKASYYISLCQKYGYPWEFKLFDSDEAAQAWLET